MSDMMIFDVETIEEDTGAQEVQKQLESGSQLEIPVETISEQKEVSSSLCDRFGIHMFTETFIDIEERLAQTGKSERQTTLKDVMTKTEEYTLLDNLQVVMKAEGETIIKKEYENKQDTESMAVLAFYGIAGAVLAGFILYYIEKIRKGRKKIENNSDIPEQHDKPGL